MTLPFLPKKDETPNGDAAANQSALPPTESNNEDMEVTSSEQESLDTTPRSTVLKSLILNIGNADNYEQELCDQFIGKWLADQLGGYYASFRRGTVEASLARIQKRFDWLNSWLVNYDFEFASIFPPEWHVVERFVTSWCSYTKDAIESRLIEMRANQTLTAGDFKSAFKATFLFEGKLDDTIKARHSNTVPSNGECNATLSFPTSDVVKSLPKSVADVLVALEAAKKSSCDKAHIYQTPKVKGAISDCFERYCQVVINDEAKWLSDAYDRALANEDWKTDAGKVFSSIRDVFDQISKCRQRIFILGMPSVVLGVFRTVGRLLMGYKTELVSLDAKADLSLATGKTQLCWISNTISYILTMLRVVCVSFKVDLPSHPDVKINMQTEFNMYVTLGDAIMRRLSAALFNTSNISLNARPATYAADLQAAIHADVELLRESFIYHLGFFERDLIDDNTLLKDMPTPKNAIGKLFKSIVKGVALRLDDLISSCNTSTTSAVTLQYMRDLNTVEAMLCSLPSLYHVNLAHSPPFINYIQMVQTRLAPAKHKLSILTMPWETLVASVALRGFDLTPIVKQ